MNKGFGTNKTIEKDTKKLNFPSEPQGRLISWSPWPPANSSQDILRSLLFSQS
tara:strand:+ start:142 stop:300 length:159 start_codon:yes stop_codon:yes gene_type:complete